jgi:hypothetical protein
MANNMADIPAFSDLIAQSVNAGDWDGVTPSDVKRVIQNIGLGEVAGRQLAELLQTIQEKEFSDQHLQDLDI